MVAITATEFARNFGRYKEEAQREPIAITSHGRTSGYFLSPYEYEQYQCLKAQSRHAYYINELSETTIEQIKNAKMATRHDHLNNLLED